jgi:ribonuclease HI
MPPSFFVNGEIAEQASLPVGNFDDVFWSWFNFHNGSTNIARAGFLTSNQILAICATWF